MFTASRSHGLFHFASPISRLLAVIVLTLALVMTGAGPARAAGLVVNTLDDELNSDGDCSLREAIEAANTDTAVDACTAGAGDDTITFNVSGTITLSSTLPVIVTGSILTIDGTGQSITISGNNAVQIISSDATLNIIALTLADASGDLGGAIYNENGTLSVVDTTFTNNKAQAGGGILNDFGTLIVSNSTFSNNSAAVGGAIGSGNLVVVVNSTFSGNSASQFGGGLAAVNLVASVNSTFSGNSAGTAGGGLFIGEQTELILINTIIADSTSGGDCALQGNTVLVSQNTNNLIEDGSCPDNGVNFLTGDPNLGPLQDNGGLTHTMALLAGSPAIDAGSNDECGWVLPGPNNLDQRGLTRPIDGDAIPGAVCDIGAFEFEPPSPPSPAACTIYGVNDVGVKDSQFFTVDTYSPFTSADLGSLHSAVDIEALDIDPYSGTIYATSGNGNSFNQKGHLFIVDGFDGSLHHVAATGQKEIEALAFRPTDGVLWGWGADKGLITIDTTTGASTLILKSGKDIEGLAWNNDGTLLYGTSQRNLFEYNPATNRLRRIATNLPGATEGLAMRPDGLLALGVHNHTTLYAYDPIAKQVVTAENISVPNYSDVEGLAWPPFNLCGEEQEIPE